MAQNDIPFYRQGQQRNLQSDIVNHQSEIVSRVRSYKKVFDATFS